MPQLYIVTISPGSNATISRRAVSNSRMVNSDAAQAHIGPGLVPDVARAAHRRERLDRLSLRQAAGVERPQPLDRLDQRHRRLLGLGVVGTHEHVGEGVPGETV